MGVRKLGFGMVGKPGGGAGAAAGGSAAAAKKNAGGFGSVGPIKASDGMFYFLSQPFCSEYEMLMYKIQPTKNNTPAISSPTKRPFPLTSSSTRATMIPPSRPRPRLACRVLRVLRLFRPTPTLAVPRRTRPSRTTAISSLLPRTSFVSSASLLVMIWRTLRRW